MTDPRTMPMSRDEFVDLMSACMHGPLPTDTVHRLIATICARDAEIERLQSKLKHEHELQLMEFGRRKEAEAWIAKIDGDKSMENFQHFVTTLEQNDVLERANERLHGLRSDALAAVREVVEAEHRAIAPEDAFDLAWEALLSVENILCEKEAGRE